MTATTGRAVLAIVAILSLLLSAFAIARPVIASHEPPDGPEVEPTAEEFGGGDPVCPAGSLGYRFNAPEEGESAEVVLADGSTATATIISLAGDALTFEVEGGLAAIVTVKGGVSSPGVPDQNVYDYRELSGGGIAHDDGLTTPNEQGISHVDFCLVPVEASILVHKTDQTRADVAGAEFTVHDGETVVDGPADTDASGLVCFDGLVLDRDYTVTETTAPDGYLGDPDSQTVAASLGNCEDRIADGDEADATFTNTLLGSLLVMKTDGSDEPLEGAEFSVTGPAEFAEAATSDADGWFCVDGLTYGAEYTVTETDAPDGYQMDAGNPKTHVIDDSATCAERLADSPAADLVFVNVADEEAPDGSIAIDKQLETCETCEAYTPGYWFNRGGGGGGDWADEWLAANPQTIAGIGTFDSVASVQAYLDADTAGDDGANGLSATGQLLRHYLALVLNVAFAEANDCDLASLTYGEGTVAEWLDAALAALEGDASDDDRREIKDALDAINNSDAGDGTLECGDSEAGPHAGVTFELYDAADQLVDSGTTGADGSLLLDGDPDGTRLPLGTYTMVEAGNDADLACTIVSVSGDGATLNEDGTVTIVLTEDNADVAISVVNACVEQLDEEDEAETGTVKVIKLFCGTDDAVEAGVEFQVERGDLPVPALEGCAVGDATFDFGGDTFSVGADGLAIFTAEVGEYGFAEIAPNAAAYTGTVPVLEGASTTVIVLDTFVEGEQGGNPDLDGGAGPGQDQTPREGTQEDSRGVTREGTLGGNPLPDTATTPAPGGSLPAMVLALISLGALAVAGQGIAAEARSRR